ncbi:D-alanyl-D-alanine carboxypeptidase family protein [Catenulispora yoronensis]
MPLFPAPPRCSRSWCWRCRPRRRRPRRDPVPAVPDLDVVSYVVADYDTGQILAEQAPHRQLYPASTLKVLTADTLIPRLSPTLAVTPKASDFAAEPDGSVVGMTAGVTYTVADLWRATFIDSANDAVAELAHLAGGLDTTVALMQKQARALGAHDTVVADADGYDANGQVTSSYDLALLARAGLHNADFRSYCALKQATFPGPGGKGIALKSHDPMLMTYPGMIGIKGGITTKAGHTYVGAATRDGHTVIETLMLGGTDIFDQAAKLMDWGLAADGRVKAVGTLGTGSGAQVGAPPATAPTATPTTPAATTSAAPTTPTAPIATSPAATTPAPTTPLTPAPTAPDSPDTAAPSQTSSSLGTRTGNENTASPGSGVDSSLPPSVVVLRYTRTGGSSSDSATSHALWLGLLAAAAALAVPLGAHAAGRRSRRR